MSLVFLHLFYLPINKYVRFQPFFVIVRVAGSLYINGDIVLIIVFQAGVVTMAFAASHFMVGQCLMEIHMATDGAAPKFAELLLLTIPFEVSHEFA